ncbi:hypothetical protein AGMMS4956_00640 [Bacteroidia bacterium]|nr:hypothetical protein AGMMS4956_00640 [Bacteroidia bacterium]
MQKNEWSPNKTKRLVKIGLIGIAVFFALFIAAGSLKDSVFVTHAWESISFYTGLSIPSLDDYLLQPRPQSDHFGEETLSGIYYFLNRIGIHFPDNYVNYKHLEFVNFNGTMGNVYTVVRRLLHDYGYWGLYFLLFAFGFIYSFLFQLIKNKRSFLLIFYAFMFYPIVMVGIDEQLCSTWFSISWVWITLYMYIFWLLFVKNKIILGRSSAHNKKQHIVPNCI